VIIQILLLDWFIVNVIIGTLKTDSSGQSFLLVNHSAIAKIIDNSMYILWPGEVHHDDVLLFLSDAASYMVKSGKAIQVFYPKIIHVICIVHGFHWIAKKIRGNYSKVDKIITKVKKVFLKVVLQYLKKNHLMFHSLHNPF